MVQWHFIDKDTANLQSEKTANFCVKRIIMHYTKFHYFIWRNIFRHKLYNGSYKGVIKREAVYKCTNKDYLPEA